MPHVFEGELHGDGLKFAVIASRFHEALVERLLEGAIECLERHGVSTESIEVYRVPGAFEIPSLAAELTRRRGYDALVAIGVLIRGDTPHFDFICSQVTSAVSRVSVESRVPISFGVITCNSLEQARERTVKGNNKGWEAALAAIEMANLYRRLGEGARRVRVRLPASPPRPSAPRPVPPPPLAPSPPRRSPPRSLAPSPPPPITPSPRRGGRKR